MCDFLIRGTSLHQHIDPDLIHAASADVEAMIGDTPALRRLQITAALVTARATSTTKAR